LISSHIVGSFTFFSILFSAFLGWIIWGNGIDRYQVIGGIVLVGAGILMIVQNNREKKALQLR